MLLTRVFASIRSMKNESGREPFDPHAAVRPFLQARYREHDARVRQAAYKSRDASAESTPEYDELSELTKLARIPVGPRRNTFR